MVFRTLVSALRDSRASSEINQKVENEKGDTSVKGDKLCVTGDKGEWHSRNALIMLSRPGMTPGYDN